MRRAVPSIGMSRWGTVLRDGCIQRKMTGDLTGSKKKKPFNASDSVTMASRKTHQIQPPEKSNLLPLNAVSHPKKNKRPNPAKHSTAFPQLSLHTPIRPPGNRAEISGLVRLELSAESVGQARVLRLLVHHLLCDRVGGGFWLNSSECGRVLGRIVISRSHGERDGWWWWWRLLLLLIMMMMMLGLQKSLLLLLLLK
jgi:hypothetical protein